MGEILYNNIWRTKNILIFSFLCSLLCGFKQPTYCKLSDKIFFAYNKEMCKRNRLSLVGKGGRMMGDIQQVNAFYTSNDRLNVEEARRLFVDVAEGYIARYNENEEIRPYLRNYPFTIDSLKIQIGFENENRQHMDGGYVALASYINAKRRIFYSGYDHETKKFTDLHEESYETALEIVQQEKSASCQ